MNGDFNSGVAGGSVMQPAVSGVPAPRLEPRKNTVVEIIILAVVSLVAVGGVSFAVYFYLQWGEAQANVDGKVAEAEAIAREDQQQIADAAFLELEKLPNRRFTGPVDYGSVSFMFPKTWSLYVAQDASGGGDFAAYMNPDEVHDVNDTTTIHALRVLILDQSIDTVRSTYDGLVSSGMVSQSVFQNGTITGDRFSGELETGIVGEMVMFKVNDKTAIVRTDARLFVADFEKIIAGITLN